ncbi:uncharacterized protein [Nicotiana tomentosiformis]|uniref:uncharacterized protein n=1 Tax=Nicotiana tomentosiformis TaxID=4098 RepID=UPI00388C9E4F
MGNRGKKCEGKVSSLILWKEQLSLISGGKKREGAHIEKVHPLVLNGLERNEQFEAEVKNLHAELEVARKEHADLVEQVKVFEVSDDEFDSVTDGQNPLVQQKLDRIDQLRAEMDIVKAETDEWRGRMDRMASEKEAARAQLTSAKIQLREAKERAEVKTKKVEELQSRLGSVVSDR